jgi:hypothetical protein
MLLYEIACLADHFVDESGGALGVAVSSQQRKVNAAALSFMRSYVCNHAQLLGLATATHSAQIMQPKLSDGAALVSGIALCASHHTRT